MLLHYPVDPLFPYQAVHLLQSIKVFLRGDVALLLSFNYQLLVIVEHLDAVIVVELYQFLHAFYWSVFAKRSEVFVQPILEFI
jgi:hypothetical protein